MTTADFFVRSATPADAAVVARHRAEMFRDIQSLSDELCAALEHASRAPTAHLLGAGEYLGWLASPVDDHDAIVAGAGIRIRPALPIVQPRGGHLEVTANDHGLIVNVYTERAWRRRGLAALLMTHVLQAARALSLANIVLHASNDGRPLYESLGFVATNEMRYAGPVPIENS